MTYIITYIIAYMAIAIIKVRTERKEKWVSAQQKINH